ncbi:tyrosine-type recombinase/integrase [Actinomadura sp. WMMA1423]|uniref:tyrosine-type recombinase/integrase n=1 Tax=Actinomadura sp. WMMA1423 TaxID=2591108 RepID=UPI001F0FB9F3|nr:tyrosine-type recombinase/integrase [Actinomadura sp. WMMA1423]
MGGGPAFDAAAALPPGKNPYLVYLSRFTKPESHRAMAGCLDRIAGLWALQLDMALPEPYGQHFPWASLRYAHTAAIRAMVLAQTRADGQPWAPAYRNKHLVALRRVLRVSWKLELMSTDDYHRACDVEGVEHRRLVVGRVITAEERAQLTAVCLADPAPQGLRDAALLESLYSTGCRRAELARATRDDYDPGSRTLIVTGKRDKQRDTYLTEAAAARLGEWLVAGRPRGPLFPAGDRWGRIGTEHMTSNGIGQVVARRARQAGVPDISPHDFRRTFTGDLLDAGVDLATVQQLLGHASASTTAGYDRRPAAARRAAVDRLGGGPAGMSARHLT